MTRFCKRGHDTDTVGRTAQRMCKECRRIVARASFEKHDHKRRAYNKAFRDSIRSALATIKVESGCVDCGYNSDPVALDFDHVRGTKEVRLSSPGSLARALKEIEKCEVRCANCHRIKTADRRQTGRVDA